MREYVDVTVLKDKTLENVLVNRDSIIFRCADGTEYKMYHEQDCCESVYLEDITEEWKDILIGAKVLEAYQSDNTGNEEPLEDYTESYTWTFYRIITERGTVVIRWYGESNGYYSETVDFTQINA